MLTHLERTKEARQYLLDHWDYATSIKWGKHAIWNGTECFVVHQFSDGTRAPYLKRKEGGPIPIEHFVRFFVENKREGLLTLLDQTIARLEEFEIKDTNGRLPADSQESGDSQVKRDHANTASL